MLFEDLGWLDDPEPHPAALNMAIDEVLLATVALPLLRTYRWARPAVSFGYFGRCAEVEAAWPGREMVRRWTGGGIVPHGEDFTYSLIVPRAQPLLRLSAMESYRAVHEAILRVLAPSLDGVALSSCAAARVSDACFENAVRHDLVARGEKVAGAAQRRTLDGLLHQGSIQLAAPMLPADFPTRLAAAFAAKVEPHSLAATTVAAAREVAAARYGTVEWLRRS